MVPVGPYHLEAPAAWAFALALALAWGSFGAWEVELGPDVVACPGLVIGLFVLIVAVQVS